MAINERRRRSASAASSMNRLPRCESSMTDAPEPFQSSISAWARCNTASGRAAGPALKFQALLTVRILRWACDYARSNRSEADQQHRGNASRQQGSGEDEPPHFAARTRLVAGGGFFFRLG